MPKITDSHRAYFNETLIDYLSGEPYEGDYSGRGMFGATCPAIAYANEQEAFSDFIDYVVGIDDAEERRMAGDILSGATFDAFGTGVIAYFPKLKVKAAVSS